MLFLRTFGHKLTPSKVSPKEINRILAERVGQARGRAHRDGRAALDDAGALSAAATSATSAWRSALTRISRRRFGGIPTCSCIARSSGSTRNGRPKGFRYALPRDGAARRALLAHRASRRRSDARSRRAAEVRLSQGATSAKRSTWSSAASSPFGLFVRLPEVQADGLVHVTALPRDYYHRDPTGTVAERRTLRARIPADRDAESAPRRRQRRGTQRSTSCPSRTASSRRPSRVAAAAAVVASRSQAHLRPARGARGARAPAANGARGESAARRQRQARRARRRARGARRGPRSAWGAPISTG